MKKLTITFLSLFFLCAVAYAATSPVPMLEKAGNQLIQQLQKNQPKLKENPQIINNLVKKIVLPHIDQMRMARSVVTRQDWVQASPSERKQFLSEFRTLVIRTYASAFSAYTNESVKFYPVRGSLADQSNAEVQSVIVRPGKPSIPVSYSLARTSSQWKIYDFSVDGVSMVRSFRSQFASLNQNGLAGLNQQLKKHNATRK